MAVVGPTASGKTSLGIELAREFDGEIVSADSRQLYRGTSVCTDIPEGKWRKIDGRNAYTVRKVPHYLMNSDSPAKPVSLAEYRRRAVWRLKEIASRGKLPILVGGSGLYVKAVVDNYDIPSVPADHAWRDSIAEKSTEELYERLNDLDPDYADRISPNNRRYIIRALEVAEKTGKTFSQLQQASDPLFDWLQLGVSSPRDVLYRKIDNRMDQMVDAGLLQETRRLAQKYGWDAHIMSSLGYNQLKRHLVGDLDLEQALELMKKETRHYAKRQLTWLRRDKRIKWVENAVEAKKTVRKWLESD